MENDQLLQRKRAALCGLEGPASKRVEVGGRREVQKLFAYCANPDCKKKNVRTLTLEGGNWLFQDR